jgi:hypothetical protein
MAELWTGTDEELRDNISTANMDGSCISRIWNVCHVKNIPVTLMEDPAFDVQEEYRQNFV